MHDRALELKVGLVLLAALVILGGFVLFLGDLRLDRGMEVNVDYNFSGAIQEGAPVKISGVKVGRVARLELRGGAPNDRGEPIYVRLVLSIEERARPILKTNTDFFVNTQGLLGENYVEIVPSRTEAPPLEDGAVVRGVDPARFDLLFARLYEFLEGVSELMADNREVFVELLRAGSTLARTLNGAIHTNEKELSRAIAGAALATERAVTLLDGMGRAVGDGKELSATITHARETTALLEKELPPLLAKLDKTLTELNRLSSALEGVDRKRVDETIDHASSALREANEVLADAKAITRRVKGGQGTIGLLIRDDEVYDDLKELLKDVKQHPWKLIWKD